MSDTGHAEQSETNSDTKKQKKPKRFLKRLLYVFLGLILLAIVGTFGAFKYAKYQWFRDTPNTLAFEDELHPVPFEWIADEYENDIEPHGAILIPVSVSGIPNKFYMQFDTGSPNTFLRSGALESLKDRGVEFELVEKEKKTCIKKFEFNVGGNRVLMESGWVMERDIAIDWEDPDAINVIGSFGADFLDQKICEIDFPAQEIRFSSQRSEALNALGKFTPFKFKGRRIMLPANIDGSDVELLYDSGCSAFGLLTSKYHYDRLTDPNEKEIAYGANRFGESVPIHHKSSDLQIKLGTTDLSLKRISYAEMYNFLQSTLGRFIGGGFLGNKSLTECTLIIDAKQNEFLVVEQSLQFHSNDPSAKPESPDSSNIVEPQLPIEIPFQLTEHNNISIEAVLNDKHKLALMFHTAADEVSLTHQSLEKMPEIKLDLEADVESWGGDSTTRFARGFKLSLGPVQLDDVTIFQSMHSGHQTDGKFGPRHLKSQFIEIDFDHSEILLHQTLPEETSDWDRLPITIENGMMFVDGNIGHDENVIKQQFMIHSGYSGFALLDDEFVANHNYINELKVIEESELTDSGGNKLTTKKSSLPHFSVGSFELENVPVSFFSGAIGQQKFSVLGGDFLKRFNLVIDLEDKTLYLKKSQYFAAKHY